MTNATDMKRDVHQCTMTGDHPIVVMTPTEVHHPHLVGPVVLLPLDTMIELHLLEEEEVELNTPLEEGMTTGLVPPRTQELHEEEVDPEIEPWLLDGRTKLAKYQK